MVTARINNYIVKRVLIDQVSGVEVMCPDLFKGLGLKNEDLSKYDTPLMGFDGLMVILEGQISLPMNMEGREVMVTFIVVTSFSLYTTILGRPWIHAMGAVSSTLHMKVKFRTEQGTAVVKGNQQVARQCLVAVVDQGIEQKKSTEETPLYQLKEPQEGMGASCAEELIKVKILTDVDKYFQVGASMRDEDRVAMLLFLVQNIDMFAWTSYDVLGVDPNS